MKKPYYINLLNIELQRRKLTNPSYSMRAFARLLNIDQASLSGVLNNKRALPLKYVSNFVKMLELTGDVKSLFLESVEVHATKIVKIKKKVHERHELCFEEFEKISSPEAIAFLTILELDHFKYDLNWISKCINASIEDTQKILKDLISLELVKELDGNLYRTKKRVTTLDEISSESIVKYHTACLSDAIRIVKDLPPEKRYFSNITLPTNINLLSRAKHIIREFEDKLESLLDEAEERNDVLRLSIQLYPIMEKHET